MKSDDWHHGELQRLVAHQRRMWEALRQPAYVMLRVPQDDETIMYELYEERTRHPHGQRCVLFVEASRDVEWARAKVAELGIWAMDNRIYSRRWLPGQPVARHLRVVRD